jgi:pimeloyl-ACP methyl ester carboxylesterase
MRGQARARRGAADRDPRRRRLGRARLALARWRSGSGVGEITLAYEDSGGGGPAVVFVHGLGGSANAWLAQLEQCRSRGWRGIAFDQRGAGRSGKPDGPYSLQVWVADLVGLLEALQIGRAALVGHSVGCMVAQRAAVKLGDRAWALALCGGALAWRPEAGPVFEERCRLARAGRMDEIAITVAATGLSEQCRQRDPRLLGMMRELIASNQPRAYAECTAATAAATMAGAEQLGCPLLAFCGEHDPVTPPAAAEAVAAAAPRGETAIVDGAAHWCMLEAPAASNAVLFDFLARHAPVAAG